MQKADVDPILRPTELTIPQFRALVNSYAQLCTQEPGLVNYEYREELKLKRLARKRSMPMDTFMDTQGSTPQSPLQPC